MFIQPTPAQDPHTNHTKAGHTQAGHGRVDHGQAGGVTGEAAGVAALIDEKAETLRLVLTRFHAALALQPVPLSLFETWAAAFGKPLERDVEIIEGVMYVLRVLQKLEAAIQESGRLMGLLRTAALETTESFKPFLDFRNFTRRVDGLGVRFVPANLGNLALIGLILKDEAARAAKPAPASENLMAALEELKKNFGRTASLPDVLQAKLMKHVDVMIWYLDHPELLNMHDLFEQNGSLMKIANRVASPPPPPRRRGLFRFFSKG